MADAQLPGGEDAVVGEPDTPSEQLAIHPEANIEHNQPAPANVAAQEPNNAAVQGEDLAPILVHPHPQDVFSPLLKSLGGQLPPEE
ncbi:hypothetical protein V565_023270 [Rhizoctonia solani 123E]|uniref:Uncharacterized protein n=1 Tax=Rhizoctonia solani 123E TaxID=1423351 RepID=A0A074S3R1_9AGAM|nr:hypothetical protein V565_023270 [Rhizoctonia solani 123E]